MKLLVFCPDTLVDTVWKEEVKQTLFDCEVHLIKSITDLINLEKLGCFNDSQDRVFILSQQVGKSGYALKPAITWSNSREAFVCPDCGQPVTEKVKNEGATGDEPKYIEQNVRFSHFNSERNNNYKCKKCKAVLWEPVNKKAMKPSHFVYSSEMNGYYPKDTRPIKKELTRLVKLVNDTSNPKTKARLTNQIENYRHLFMIINETKPESRRIAVQKVSVAEYIFKKMRGKFTNLIIDEFHEMQGDSSRSEACVQLINSIPVIQTGTGTGMNGYAYSRFKTDYMLYPEKLKAAGFKVDDKERYQTIFGVTEKRYRLVKESGKDKKNTLAPVAKPGISPVIFPLFMQDTTVFVNISDLKDDLPTLKHYQIEVPIDPELKAAKEQLEKDIEKIAKHDKRMFKNSIQVGYSFLDSPTIEKELKDRDTKKVVLKTPTVSAHKDNKMLELINLAKNEVQLNDRKMMVYTYFTGDGINQYINNKLTAEGFKVTVLNRQEEKSISCDGTTRKVKKEERELFIREEVKKGTEILVVNPELVKTGYNLIDFPTICYYQMSYQVYTNRQADRRAWRIGQTKDCKIVYIYYAESIQADIAALMATKIVASQAIEGNMDAAGLEAICSDRTAEEELAKKFFEGIRSKVNLDAYGTEKNKAS